MFRDWLAGDPKALWVHGGMGCGKTWLLTRIDDILRQGSKNRVAACYFSNVAAAINARSVICSLLSQLGLREKIHPALHALVEELEKTPSVVTPTTQQLQETLLGVLGPDGLVECETFVLVDALDEIPFQSQHGERAKIAKLLNMLASSQDPSLHLLMTSRAHGDLVNSFGGPQAIWSASPIPADSIQAGIEFYVCSKIAQLAESVYINENDQKRLVTRLAGPGQTM